MSLTVFNTPGTYISENTYGAIPAGLADHSAVYVLGTGSTGVEDVPTYVTNIDDFTNVFGASPSAAALDLFFNQRTGTGVWFVNVSKRSERSITIPTATEGLVYSVTVDGFTVSYTAIAGDTVAKIRSKLGDKINKTIPHIASYYADGIIRYVPGLTVTVNSNVTLGSVVAVSAYPKVKDVSDTINTAFTPEMTQGYLCAPEFFQSFTTLSDRTFLATAMESLTADPNYYWVSVVDCGESVATQTTVYVDGDGHTLINGDGSSLLANNSSGGGAINAAITERNLLTSPRGHSWYYFPYLINSTDTLIPPSLAVIGVAIRRNRLEGFAQPPAGVTYPIYGVKDLSFNVKETHQSQLNPLGINCIRHLPAGRGIVVYGARTLSIDPNYRFGSVRVIMNVLAGSLRTAYDALIFSLVDGQGALFSRIRQTAANVCERLRSGGALFGATADQAYYIICDLTNNDLNALEQGVVSLDVRVKPSPTMEVLDIRLSRASLGAVLAEVAQSGTIAAVRPSGSQVA